MPQIPDSVGEWSAPQGLRPVTGYQTPEKTNLGPAEAGIQEYGRSVQGLEAAQADVGKGMQDVGNVVGTLEDRKALIDATNRSNGFQADVQNYLYNPQDGAITTKLGQNADGIGEKTQEYLTGLRDKYSKDVTNPMALKTLNEDFARMTNSASEMAMRHEAEQHKVFADSTLGDTVKNQQNAVAFNPSDNKGFADALSKATTAAGHLANLNGLDPAEKIRNTSSDLWTTRIKTALTSNDPASIAQAGQWYKQAKSAGQLNYQDDDTLGTALKAVVPKNEALVFHQQTRNQDLTKYISPATLYQAGQAGPPGAWAKAIAPSVAKQESGSKETGGAGSVVGPDQVTTSPKGAQGDMQVMPDTGADPGFGVKPAQDDSAAERDRVGTDYLAAMKNRYGDNQLALAAYNAGPGKVDAAIEKAGSKDPARVLAQLPAETQNYVPKVLGYAAQNQIVNGQGIDPATIQANAAKLPADQRPFYVAAATQENQQTVQAYSQARNAAIDAMQVDLANANGNINGVRPETLAAAHKYGVADALMQGHGESDGALLNQIKALNTEQLSNFDFTDPNVRMRLNAADLAEWTHKQGDIVSDPKNADMMRKMDNAVRYTFGADHVVDPDTNAPVTVDALAAVRKRTENPNTNQDTENHDNAKLYDQMARFRDLLGEQVRAAYAQTGKPPSDNDIQQMADRIIMNRQVSPAAPNMVLTGTKAGGFLWRNQVPVTKAMAALTVEDVPDDKRAVIEEGLRRIGHPVNDASVLRAYEATLKYNPKAGYLESPAQVPAPEKLADAAPQGG